jgi:hypothetical protein
MNEADIITMTPKRPFQYVTNITHDGPDKISFWVGDLEAFKRVHRTAVQKLQHALIPASLTLPPIYAFTLGYYREGVGLFLILLPFAIWAGWYFFNQNSVFDELRLHYDRSLKRITVADPKLPQSDTHIDQPVALKVAAHFMGQQEQGQISWRMLSLRVVTQGKGDVKDQVTGYYLVQHSYDQFENMQVKRNELAAAFQFLADWLAVPLLIESHLLHQDSNIRHYF